MNTGTAWMHNVVDFLGGDPAIGANDGTCVEHRGWFSNDAGMTQACFTARGDKEEYALMVENYVQKTIEFIKAQPAFDNIVIGQMDVISGDRVSRCACASCNAAYAYYGDTNAGAQLAFTNDVSVAVNEWLQTDEAKAFYKSIGMEKKFMNVLVLVYGSSINPPVQRTESGAVLFDENGNGVMKQWFDMTEADCDTVMKTVIPFTLFANLIPTFSTALPQQTISTLSMKQKTLPIPTWLRVGLVLVVISVYGRTK